MPSAVLSPHPETPCALLRGIEVLVEHAPANMLAVTFTLDGKIDELRIPPPGPARVADRLWQHTCCEIFIAPGEGAGYREYNFSPSREWAAYEFRAYRQGAPVQTRAPAIEVQRSARRLQLTAGVEAIGSRIGIAAVIEAADGSLSYWALRHAPGKPDFHHPSTFALDLDEVRH
jgi:hypothetical protein